MLPGNRAVMVLMMRRRAMRGVVGRTAAAACFALAASPVAAQATLPGRNGVLAVVTGDAGVSGGQRIVLVRGDGTLVRRIGCPAGCSDSWPAWSPDGRLLAFSTRISPAETRLAIVRADGTRRRTLPRPAPFVDAIAPAWSPDGARIAFGAVGFDVGGIWTADARGRDVRRLSPRGQLPALSAGGAIAVGTGGVAVWTMRADGSHERRLTSSRSDDPDWSPGGTRIAYTRFTRGREEIWTMTAGGRDKRRVAQGSMPSWSPDGRSIAFVRGSRIFISVARGGGLRKLPYAPRRSDGRALRLLMPAWQPLPR